MKQSKSIRPKIETISLKSTLNAKDVHEEMKALLVAEIFVEFEGEMGWRQTGVENKTSIEEPCQSTGAWVRTWEARSNDARSDMVEFEKYSNVEFVGKTFKVEELTGNIVLDDDKPVVKEENIHLYGWKIEISNLVRQNYKYAPKGLKLWSFNAEGDFNTPKKKTTNGLKADFSKVGNLHNILAEFLEKSKSLTGPEGDAWKIIRDSAREIVLESEKANETAKIVIGAVESGEKLFD